MKYLLNKSFQRDLKDNRLDDDYVRIVLSDIYKDQSVSLGNKLYKIRSASSGSGKSGGYRNIFYWKRNELIIFMMLFKKNEQDNLGPDDKKALRHITRDFDQLTESQIKLLIKKKLFKEIEYDQSS
jgi:hypothetical protein